ncbi:flagellar hook-basal body complex protein [Lysinibacillus endophyticus]|uniref:flagellar hook-basal body complex protein n=1 Tax=Ureibacillus endophyticus TaxID=1978490 RepID=UPI0020A20CC7|nr:flagellar hook-basal body complex protein [Lysinibacillus endophyticus]MCP1144050.1 flagellar hook-basal body complex protein [Lysinibacillus endophyticus]
MLRSMYSSISGLKNHQTKLDVIGNNISNVNTYGYKKSRVAFKDLVSQSVTGATAATATQGGVNPKQVGLGSQMAAIDIIHSTGSLQTTARTLDLAINGDGFFVVADSIGAPNEGVIEDPGFTNMLYTRAGNCYMDANGYLVNGDGKYLVGHANDVVSINDDESIPGSEVDAHKAASALAGINGNLFGDDGIDVENDIGPIRIPTTAQSMSIGQDGTITYVDYKGDLQYAGQLILAKFPNTGGLEKVGSNYYQQTSNSGAPYAQVAKAGGIGTVESGFLEMSNVDLSEEFTEMIVAQRGFQANSRIISTSDQILEELVNLKR